MLVLPARTRRSTWARVALVRAVRAVRPATVPRGTTRAALEIEQVGREDRRPQDRAARAGPAVPAEARPEGPPRVGRRPAEGAPRAPRALRALPEAEDRSKPAGRAATRPPQRQQNRVAR